MKTKFHSFCTGALSEGCKACVKGRKLVLFITGLCGQRCFYCPVSEEKFGRDVVFANEWKIVDPENPVELFREAELTEASGAGITGGDPLVKVERCCKYIRLLKERFGKEFHIHLYTPLKLVSEERLKELFDAGLDEIRFHLNLSDRSLWDRLNLALKYSWDVGVEVPAVPGRVGDLKAVVDFISDKVKFLNLNELELSDTLSKHYDMSGFKARDSVSYAVEDSRETALEVLKYAEDKGLSVHFCTAKLKNSVQLANRLKLRSKNCSLWFDVKTNEGLLVRGCVYVDLVPGFGYREKIKNVDKRVMFKKLESARDALVKLGILGDNVVVDCCKFRLLLPRNIVSRFSMEIKELGFVPAIVEEFPSVDAIETDIEFL